MSHLSEEELIAVAAGETVSEHARGCPQCRAQFEALARTMQLVDRWMIEAPPAPVLARARDAVLARFARTQRLTHLATFAAVTTTGAAIALTARMKRDDPRLWIEATIALVLAAVFATAAGRGFVEIAVAVVALLLVWLGVPARDSSSAPASSAPRSS